MSCLDKLVSVYKSDHSVILLFCSCTVGKPTSAVLLPQLQNFYHASTNFLILCYLSSRIFSSEKYSATPVAEFFSFENYSATLLSQWQNFSHLRIIQLLCYLSSWIFFIWEIFRYSATLLPQWQNFLICETLATILLLCSHLNSSNFYSVSAITVNEISVNFEF